MLVFLLKQFFFSHRAAGSGCGYSRQQFTSNQFAKTIVLRFWAPNLCSLPTFARDQPLLSQPLLVPSCSSRCGPLARRRQPDSVGIAPCLPSQVSVRQLEARQQPSQGLVPNRRSTAKTQAHRRPESYPNTHPGAMRKPSAAGPWASVRGRPPPSATSPASSTACIA